MVNLLKFTKIIYFKLILNIDPNFISCPQDKYFQNYNYTIL